MENWLHYPRNGSGVNQGNRSWPIRSVWICRSSAPMLFSSDALYPLNSLMIHGLVIGERANPKRMSLDEISVRNEIRTMFGSGTELQELYISPHLLTQQMWDDLAEAAKWARKNADILVDSHWIGGNPGELEVYGWAAWTPRAGTVTLRNPDSKSHEFSLDPAEAFEHPAGVSTGYVLQSPYEAQRIQTVQVKAGGRHVFRLEPFEVLVFDAVPVKEDR